VDIPPDVFADVGWWRRPRGWYGPPPTVTPNKEALRELRAKLADLEQQEDELNGS
jgi:hypothetical protein